MWRCNGLVGTDVSNERIASTLEMEATPSHETSDPLGAIFQKTALFILLRKSLRSFQSEVYRRFGEQSLLQPQGRRTKHQQ
jgi:hypothetical protein